MNKKVGQDTQVIPEYKPGLVKTMNALAVILAIILLIVIYVPASIWSEEAAIQKESRWRMKLINEVQRYYKQLTGEYQPDPILAMKIVQAVRDSSRADSLFRGSQLLRLKEGRFKVI